MRPSSRRLTVADVEAGGPAEAAGAAGGEPLGLVPAPERRFDPALLAVETADGELLGYLPGTHSRALGAVVEAGFAVTNKALAMRRHPRPALELEIWLDG